MLRTIWITIVRNFRDRKSLLLQLVFPVVLILILGTALNDIFAPKKYGKIDVYYMNNDEGDFGLEFNKFLSNEKIQELLNLKEADSYEVAKDEVDKGEITGFIFVPEDFSKSILEGEKGNIEVITSGFSQGGSSVIKNIIESYENAFNGVQAVYRVGGQPVEYKKQSNIEEMPISYTGKIPRAIDYYAVTMLVMIIMYGMDMGNYSLGEDKNQHTDIRIKSSSTRSYKIFVGKTMGHILTLFIQGVLIIAFTKFVYKANWSGNLFVTLLTLFVLAVFTIALGMFFYSIFRNTRAASGIISVVIPVFTFISGGYIKTSFLGPSVEKLSVIAPNSLAQRALFTNIYGMESDVSGAIWNSLGILSVFAVIFFILAIVAEGRKVK